MPIIAAVHVDRDRFVEQGFLHLKGVVPADRLAQTRWYFETALERQKLVWAEERAAEDPPGGYWETAWQPRLRLDLAVEPATSPAVELLLGESTLGVCRRLMQAEPLVAQMQMLCSPIVDHGYTDWHRDMDSIGQAPIQGIQRAFMRNGPAMLQWNIALYDDAVFWVVPGSHARPETDAEMRQLLRDPYVPLPGGQQIELAAGDGLVYSNMLLHWGSMYLATLRRTIHPVYVTFGGPYYPHSDVPYWDLGFDFSDRLGAEARVEFARMRAGFAGNRDRIERFMRAVIGKDRAAFHAALDALHPSPHDRIVTVIFMSQWAGAIATLSRGAVRAMTKRQQAEAVERDPTNVAFYQDVSRRFTEEEGRILRERFAGLNERLRRDREACYRDMRTRFAGLENVPGDPPTFDFRNRSTRTFYNAMPADYDVGDFIAGW